MGIYTKSFNPFILIKTLPFVSKYLAHICAFETRLSAHQERDKILENSVIKTCSSLPHAFIHHPCLRKPIRPSIALGHHPLLLIL